MKNLELRIFRFDKQKDYEAYYKPRVYNNYKGFAAPYDLLLQVQSDDIYFDFEKNDKSYIVANKEFLPLNTPLDILVKRYDFNLTTESLSTKRSVRDLIINKDDFLEKFKYPAPFVSEEDKELYEKYDYLYYSSEILDFLPEYMDDVMLYLTSKMIEEYPNKRTRVLKTIYDTQKGIFYHLTSKNEDLESTVKSLQKEIIDSKFINKAALEFDLPKINAFGNEIKELGEVKYDFDNSNVACYGFKIKDDIKLRIRARFISYENNDRSSGSSLLQLNPELSYRMAANIILDACDSGTDPMVVNQAKGFCVFDICLKKLIQSSGREFKDFYILNCFESLSSTQGIKNPSLQDHDLKVSLT